MAKTPQPNLTYFKPIPLPNPKLLWKLMANSLYGSTNSTNLNKMIERNELIQKIENSFKIELLNKNYSFTFGYIYNDNYTHLTYDKLCEHMVSNTNNLVFYTNSKIYLDYLYLPVYIKNRIEINPLLMLYYFKNFIESEFNIGDVLKGCSLVYIYTSNNEMNSCEVMF